MKDDQCIFCNLANGEIPTNTIYEDEDFRVILDADPASKGHALILPKEHYRNIYDLDPAIAAKIFPLAQKLAKHMTEVLHCDGFNILQNNNEVAGQSVFHFHLHLIPRYVDQPNKNLLEFSHCGMKEDEIKAVCEKLKMN